MAIGEFGALTREFYIAEIRTWENYGGKRVWPFMGGRYNEALLYVQMHSRLFLSWKHDLDT